ncbi:SDR family oxidoreductase [Mycobacterium kiyosense]|uniref:SDR family oxidoreductase n=1 Tax=Mycobacterium kiyosense TaxID=2871094 RepID=UPI002230B44E|nr:SDR family oxidoreductase [Mycobacterium kiyosense]
MTGGTGFVGSHMLARLLSEPSDSKLAVLARPNSACSCEERVGWALKLAGHTRGDRDGRMSIVESELSQPLCGIEPGSISFGSEPLIFWHFAASLEWSRGRREAVFATNVDGTRNALELATHVNADLFIYISTAYTCGSLNGDLPEALHVPPTFHNAYEESKCAAEHIVAQSKAFRTLILRPSVIVGTSHDHKPSGSYTGLYGFITELRRFKDMLGDSKDVVRFEGDRAARISFIPVDHVIEDSLAVVNSEMQTPRQDVYHISGESCSAVGDICDYIIEKLSLSDRLEMVDEPLTNPTPLEKFFAKRLDFFAGYMRNERRFTRSIGPSRSIVISDLYKFIDAEMQQSAQ